MSWCLVASFTLAFCTPCGVIARLHVIIYLSASGPHPRAPRRANPEGVARTEVPLHINFGVEVLRWLRSPRRHAINIYQYS